MSTSPDIYIEGIPQTLPILYQDEYLVAVYKPPGLLVHRSWLAKEARVFAMQLVRDQLGQHVYPVHRLDRPTSGVLLMARSSEIAKALGEAFSHHLVTKRYLAIVRGYIEGAHFLDYPLVEQSDKMTDAKAQQDKPAQEAQTRYRGLALAELPYPSGNFLTSRYSLVELEPLTGRKHQLRRHLHHLSHPIIGDTTHGDGKHNQLFKKLDMAGLWLHAHQLNLPHPVTGEELSVISPLTKRWLDAFKCLGWESSLISYKSCTI